MPTTNARSLLAVNQHASRPGLEWRAQPQSPNPGLPAGVPFLVSALLLSRHDLGHTSLPLHSGHSEHSSLRGSDWKPFLQSTSSGRQAELFRISLRTVLTSPYPGIAGTHCELYLPGKDLHSIMVTSSRIGNVTKRHCIEVIDRFQAPQKRTRCAILTHSPLRSHPHFLHAETGDFYLYLSFAMLTSIRA